MVPQCLYVFLICFDGIRHHVFKFLTLELGCPSSVSISIHLIFFPRKFPHRIYRDPSMKMIHLDPPITPPIRCQSSSGGTFFSFPEPSDFRFRHLGGPIIQAWTQRQHGRHQHGPDHKGIHHDAEDENKAHLVGDCHTSKHHAGLSSITARKRCNLKWVSITPVNDCQPTSANCFKKAKQPSKCMEMSFFEDPSSKPPLHS